MRSRLHHLRDENGVSFFEGSISRIWEQQTQGMAIKKTAKKIRVQDARNKYLALTF